MLKCRDMTEIATDYAEGALPWHGKLAARWHLVLCSACRAYYDQLAKTARLLRGRSLDGLTPQREAELLRAAKAAAPRPD